MSNDAKTTNLAAAFMALFEGLRRFHGRYVVPKDAKPDAEGKLTGPRSTVAEPVTLELWVEHLSGGEGLGITPINEESLCRFGAIDVDVYPLDLKALNAEVLRLSLPLVVCRTKSGGAHLYLFLTEFAPAELVRSKLMEMAVALGHPGVEVFPKQVALANEDDFGNWINVPYHSGRRGTRYGLGPDGRALSPDEFLAHAQRRAVSPDALRAFSPPRDDGHEELWRGAPPCLETLARKGFGDWQNNGLFNVGVYLRKRYGEGFDHDLRDYNARLMDPPVDERDVRAIAKSVRKKDYSYMCRQEPVCGVCNRQVCLTREFGVAGARDDPGVTFGELSVLGTDPPTWLWDVDGARLELTTAQLMDQRAFHAVAMERLRKWPVHVKEETWREMVREKLARAQAVQVPEDATKEGQLWVQLSKFCTSRVTGASLDELLLGRPYTDPELGRTFFCANDFLLYLQQRRVTVTERDLYRFLRRRGVEHHFAVIKGKGLNHWSVPAFERQTEDHAVPRKAPEDAM